MFPSYLLLVLAFVLFTAAKDVRMLKKHTYYNTTEYEVFLYNQNIGEIEIEAFKDSSVYHLRIIDNPLQELKKGIFSNVSMHQIVINNNQITSIEPGTFHGLKGLENRSILLLSLRNNNLRSISKGIFNGTRFRKLFLNTNRISYIEPGSFDRIACLFELDLSDNLLETINVGVFQNLVAPRLWVTLRLGQNKIKFIDPYAFENTTLFSLNLIDNQLKELKKNYFKNTDIGRLYV